MTLVNDAEWGVWSGEKIAKRCGVSAALVSMMKHERRSLLTVESEPTKRTVKVTTKHGTDATIQVENIGKKNGAGV